MTSVLYRQAMEANLNVLKAVFEVQKSLTPIRPEGDNEHFNSSYLTFDQVWQTLQPLFAETGLLCLQNIWNDEARPMLVTQIIHVDTGEKIISHCPLLVERNSMQGLGSAITYARRYSLCALFGMSELDDDGNQNNGESDPTDEGKENNGESKNKTPQPYNFKRPSKTITVKQEGLFWGKAKKAGLTTPLILAHLEKEFGYANLKDVPMDKFNEILAHFDAYKPGEGWPKKS